MAALNYRRAVLLACIFLAAFLFIRSIRSEPESPLPFNRNSPPPIGTYDEIRKVLDWNEPQKPSKDAVKNAATTTGVAAAAGAGIDAIEKTAKARLQRPQQIPIENLKQQPLRKQLATLYPYNVEEKFPAYIWQTWKTSPSTGDFPEEYRPLEASWSVLHPSLVHEVITDDVASHLVRHLYAPLPEVFEAYEAMPVPVLKADFFRYLILLARGGIYSDIDTMALKSAIDWVPQVVPRSSYGMVIGIEADPDRPDWKDWYARRVQFCQWTIQSKPGHPVLVDVVASIIEETFKRKKAGTLKGKSHKDIIEFTGPALWTDAIFKYFNNPLYFDMNSSKGNISWHNFTGIEQSKQVGDVIVLPITSFSPGVGQMGAKDDDDPMAFVKHSFEGTWL